MSKDQNKTYTPQQSMHFKALPWYTTTLKWFNPSTISISHTVTTATLAGKNSIYCKAKAKKLGTKWFSGKDPSSTWAIQTQHKRKLSFTQEIWLRKSSYKDQHRESGRWVEKCTLPVHSINLLYFLAIALDLASWRFPKKEGKEQQHNRRCRFTLEKTIYGDTTSALF